MSNALSLPELDPRVDVTPDEDSPLALDGLAARAVADLMMAMATAGLVTSVVLEPGACDSSLRLETSDRKIELYSVPAEIATAACVRLATAARLESTVRASSPEGAANVAKVRVRARAQVAELLVSVVGRGEGLEAEVRPLTINGQVPAGFRAIQLKRCTRCGVYQPAQCSECDLDGAPLIGVEDNPEIGGSIGPYLIRRVLGEGGNGIVFEGKHAIIGSLSAIKVLNRTCDPMDARNFLSEARAAARLRHRNVVEVTGYGILPGERPYLVMELLDGVTLHERLAEVGSFDARTALRVAREIARGLGAAHDAGIVHNDLKPANIVFLAEERRGEPRLKVLDFGAASQAGSQQNADGTILCTPLYMSPELARGAATDARSDIYALGVVLYEMLTGAPPFPGDDVTALASLHLSAPVPPMQVRSGALPREVSALVARCLRKSPDERPQSASELASQIDSALSALSRPTWRRWLR